MTATIPDFPQGPDRELTPAALAAMYGLSLPSDACMCCGAALYDGRCNSWDAGVIDRPANCTCPTGEVQS